MITLGQKVKLLQGLLSGETAKTGPLYLEIDVTRRCNLHCVGCPYHSTYIKDTRPLKSAVLDVPPQLVKQLSHELKTMGTKNLILQGSGEPFLHPNFFEMISLAKTAGLHVTSLTNGTLLDKDRINALIDTRLDKLKVSLWASSSDQYQQNYPGTSPQMFQKVVDGVKLLATIKSERKSQFPHVIMHLTINRFNFQTIDDYVKMALEIGCDSLSFAPFNTFGKRKLSQFILTPDEKKVVRTSLIRAKKHLNSLSVKHNIDTTLFRYDVGDAVWQEFPCYIAWYHVRIRVDGTVQPCGRSDVVFGNLQNESFQEIWNSPSIRSFRKNTITRDGLKSMGEKCNCNLCFFVGNNMNVHRIFKWISPFMFWTKNSRFYR